MEFTIKTGSLEKLKSGALVVASFGDQGLAAVASQLDQTANGSLSAILARGDLADEATALLQIHDLPGCRCERVLVASMGAPEHLDENRWRTVMATIGQALASSVCKEAILAMDDFALPNRDSAWTLQQATRILANAQYRYQGSGHKHSKIAAKRVRKITFLISERITSRLEQALRYGQDVARGMALTRELGDLPPNVCTPTFLAETAEALAQQFKLKLKVLNRADMAKRKMRSLLAVTAGSHQPPKLIVLQYQGGKAKAAPIVLVGKGVTFDSGGISLKPGAGMDEMKYDMCGAASVLGTVKAVASMQLPINLVAIIPATENMPGGSATRPGDVVTSLSGQTIEILNTDAEGRLILCDALSYASQFNPTCVIDIATLTGACVVALGKIPSGLFANDEALASQLLHSGNETGDRAWRLPLWDEYQELLKSNFADMANIGDRNGGAITAACFLARFTKEYRWAHLDIAGTAWLSGTKKGATGRPVPLLCEFLIQQASSH